MKKHKSRNYIAKSLVNYKPKVIKSKKDYCRKNDKNVDISNDEHISDYCNSSIKNIMNSDEPYNQSSFDSLQHFLNSCDVAELIDHVCILNGDFQIEFNIDDVTHNIIFGEQIEMWQDVNMIFVKNMDELISYFDGG